MNYLFPIIATNKAGDTKIFYDSDSFRAFAFNRKNKVGSSWTYYDLAWSKEGYSHVAKTNDWIVRDDRGKIVNPSDFHVVDNRWRIERLKKIRHHQELGLPIPGQKHSKPWKMNHTAKKNSGSGHRNRNRAKAMYEFSEYGIKSGLGRVIPYEGW